MKKKLEPKKDNRGRPRIKFSKAVADRICREIAEGKSLRRTLKKQGMPRLGVVMNWLEESTTFREQYARARQRGIDLHIDGMLDLADRATEKNANAMRLRIDTRKWIASKLLPKVYGDRLDLTAMVDTPTRDATTVLGQSRRVAFVLAQGAIAKSEIERSKRPALPAPAPDPIFRDRTPADAVRGAHPGGSSELRDINEPPGRGRPKPGDAPTWHYGSAAEMGRDE